MNPALHPDLQLLLEFYLRQRREPPEAYAVGTGVISAPSFFSVDALQRHLNNPLLQPDWIHLIAHGQSVPLETACMWKVVQKKKLQFIDKTLIDEQLRQGAAVVLEGVDILEPQINAFVAEVDAALPCALSNCVAFFSQRDNEAYAGHRDSDDVLVVQISGEKLWNIYAPQQRRYFGNSPLVGDQLGPRIAEVVLRPGDALYARAGVPHLCKTSGNHSLHLAFDLCDRTPSIELITQEANTRYNHSSEAPYAAPEKVTQRYVNLLQSTDFQRELDAATRQTKTNATTFRQRIGRAAGVTALSRYTKQN